MKNRRIMRNWLLNLFVFCLSASVAIGQGTIGQYPGAGVGFDSGCGYPDAGVINPATTNPGLTSNCGSTTDVNTGVLFESTTGFDIPIEILSIEANELTSYGLRIFYGPQNLCCTICLDAVLRLGQNTPCGQIAPVPDVTTFPSPATGMPFPASVINFGELAFGQDLIPHSNMCPNTEYFVEYQVVISANDDVSDPDGNLCALDDSQILSFGTLSTGTIVAPGTRDPLLITSANFDLDMGESCQSPSVVLELTAEILAGCSALGEDRICSQGMELEFRNPSSACLNDLVTGPLINDPTACLTGVSGMPFITTVSIGDGQAVCDLIAACGGTGTIELYATHTFCESDDIIGDGSGNDEAVIVIDVLSALSTFNCANCPTVCDITPEPAANIVCNDNGTPFDPSDDTFTFDILVNGSNTDPTAANTFTDDQGNTGIPYGTTQPYGPFPIAGGAVTVNFTDADDAMCIASMMAAPPATCSDAVCTITPDVATNIVCDDNGTPADPSDDTFTFDITVNGSNTATGASNTFNDDQGNTGIAYGTAQSYGPFPIAGGSITVNFTDADAPASAACTASMMATPPTTCSGAECTISPDPVTNIVCDDNGTPGDPSDDTFTFDIAVNGNSTFPGATNTFNDDQGNVGIAYGTLINYDNGGAGYPISGGNVTVMFTDADEATCTGMMMAAAPATCSGAECTITPDPAANIVCDDNGTPDDPSDDTFTFDITVNGSSTFPGATNTFNDDQGNAGIAYGTTQSYGPFSISGGNVTVMFTDADEASCTGMMMAAAPATCSGADCTITPDPAANIVCDDNGTPDDPSDDTFTFDITVNGSSSFPGATNTFNDDQGNTGVAYGTTVSYGPFPIAGGNITVMFTDADEATCTGMMMAAAPATCSGADCTITPDAATNIVCDDNGTPGDPSDDTYTFDITVNGSSTFPGTTNTFNDDQGNSGIAYGTTVSYGPFPIAGGDVMVTFTDADEASCTGMMMAAAPTTCSAGICEDGIAGSIESQEVGCIMAGIEVTIYDSTGAVVGVATADADGNYALTGVYPCGNYTAELTANVPDCFTGSGGTTGPIGFNVNGDGNPDGANFTEVGEVPTLSQWGLMILALLMMTFGALKISSFTVRTANSRK